MINAPDDNNEGLLDSPQKLRGRKHRNAVTGDFSKESTIYTSMKKLSLDKGVPVPVLKAARDANAPGFAANGRLDWTLIAPWLADHSEELVLEDTPESLTVWKTRLIKAQAERAELELDKTRGNYVLKSEVLELIAAIAIAQKNLLKTRLTQELPPKLYGLKVDEIIGVMEGAVKEVCQLMQDAKI